VPRISQGALTVDVAALQFKKCSGWVIRGFKTDSTFTGILIDSCAHMVIEQNRCTHHNERASFHGVGINVSNSSDIIIRRNVVIRNEYIGIIVTGSRVQIINNTVGKTAGGYEAIFVSGGATHEVDIINNILFSTGKNSLEYGYGATQDGAVRYNIFWAAGESPYCQNCTLDSTNMVADPLFVDTARDNYLLKTNSPAINRGDSTLKDPDSSRSDIGAYVLGATVNALRGFSRSSDSRLMINATHAGFFVRIPSGSSRSPVGLSIFSAGGRLVRSLTIPAANYGKSVFIPVEHLSAASHAVYFVRVAGENGRMVRMVSRIRR
jgi:parallel beta-helix repeat protein